MMRVYASREKAQKIGFPVFHPAICQVARQFLRARSLFDANKDTPCVITGLRRELVRLVYNSILLRIAASSTPARFIQFLKIQFRQPDAVAWLILFRSGCRYCCFAFSSPLPHARIISARLLLAPYGPSIPFEQIGFGWLPKRSIALLNTIIGLFVCCDSFARV